MSKTRRPYNKDDNYGNDEVVETRKVDRSKQKRIDRALRTKNIDELMALDDEPEDNIDAYDMFYYSGEEDYQP